MNTAKISAEDLEFLSETLIGEGTKEALVWMISMDKAALEVAKDGSRLVWQQVDDCTIVWCYKGINVNAMLRDLFSRTSCRVIRFATTRVGLPRLIAREFVVRTVRPNVFEVSP